MNPSPFTPEDLRHFQEHQRAASQLEKVGNVWISPDISIENPVVVGPGQYIQNVKIILNKTNLPPDIDITRGAMGLLSFSVRSFLAQSGIEIRFFSNSFSDIMQKEIKEGKDVLVPVEITNHGQRAVALDGNVMRFFWVNDKKRLRGQELVKSIESGEFSVEGKLGEDWFLCGYKDDDRFVVGVENVDKGLGVALRLEDQKFYIPPDPEPVRIDNTRSRKDLSNFLQRVPKGTELDFEIGETPEIRLGPNIVAVINLGVDKKNQRHIYSPLIDSGTKGKIRTEILYGPETQQYVEFFLYRRE